MGIARSGRAEIVVDAPPEKAWQVVSDVTRTGEWSGECTQVRRLGGAAATEPGVRFRGRNRHRLLRWSRTCELTTVDAPREIAWRTLPSPLYPDSTAWRITLEPAGAGTRIVETYRVTQMPRWFEAIVSRTIPDHHDRTAALAADLQRLGSVVDRAADAEPRA